MQKVQQSLLVVNVAVLALFVVGVAAIVHTEEAAPSSLELSTRAIVRGGRAGEDAQIVEQEAALATQDSPVTRECAPSGCNERSVLAPILFAFLAGGIMNLPEVTALPCI